MPIERPKLLDSTCTGRIIEAATLDTYRLQYFMRPSIAVFDLEDRDC